MLVLGTVCFWLPMLSQLNLVVAAVLRDSLCVVSLLPSVADRCTLCKVERFVLTIIKRRLLLLLLHCYRVFHGNVCVCVCACVCV